MVENQDNMFYNNSQESNFHSLEAISTDDLMSATEDMMLNMSPGFLTLAADDNEMHPFHPQETNIVKTEFLSMQYVHPTQQQHHQQIAYPEHFKQLPILEDLDTPWNFEINLNGENSGKTSWMHSSRLNKVFVKINSYLNVYPRYDVQIPNEELFLRTMIVYTSLNEMNEPVNKCPNHRDQSLRDNITNPEHILRCPTSDTQYFGLEKGKLFQDKLAIRVPMRNVAANEPIQLLFTCQNSCSGGINRKSTSLIFILENGIGKMYGRRVLHFKVCSCPKRDKDKEEATMNTSIKILPKKRKLEHSAVPSTSKKVALAPVIKQESDISMNSVVTAENTESMAVEDTCELRMWLPNADIKKKVLQSTYNILAGEMHRDKDANYEKCIADLKAQLDDL